MSPLWKRLPAAQSFLAECGPRGTTLFSVRFPCACVTSNEDIWKEVWTEDERINNASTPMFLVQAVKTAAAEEGSR